MKIKKKNVYVNFDKKGFKRKKMGEFDSVQKFNQH